MAFIIRKKKRGFVLSRCVWRKQSEPVKVLVFPGALSPRPARIRVRSRLSLPKRPLRAVAGGPAGAPVSRGNRAGSQAPRPPRRPGPPSAASFSGPSRKAFLPCPGRQRCRPPRPGRPRDVLHAFVQRCRGDSLRLETVTDTPPPTVSRPSCLLSTNRLGRQLPNMQWFRVGIFPKDHRAGEAPRRPTESVLTQLQPLPAAPGQPCGFPSLAGRCTVTLGGLGAGDGRGDLRASWQCARVLVCVCLCQ